MTAVPGAAPPPSTPRQVSRRLVLQELGQGAALSRVELIERTGLSRGAVGAVLARLAQERRVVSQGRGRSQGGRPAELFRLASFDGLIAGVDLGHSHLTVAIATANGTIVAEHTESSNIDASGDSALRTAAAALTELSAGLAAATPDVVVVGVPGPLERRSDGTTRAGGLLPGWSGVDPARTFAEHLDDNVTVQVDNDAHLGAIGETALGAARGFSSSLYVKIGSGIGSGMMVGGLLHRGGHGTAGEIGHIRVVQQGELCRCGNRGCLETVASMSATVRSMQRLFGPAITQDEVLRLLKASDPTAVRLFTDVGEAIGQVLAGTIAAFDPDVVVIGTQVPDNGLIVGAVDRTLRRSMQPFTASMTRVIPGELGTRASIHGAIARASRIVRRRDAGM